MYAIVDVCVYACVRVCVHVRVCVVVGRGCTGRDGCGEAHDCDNEVRSTYPVPSSVAVGEKWCESQGEEESGGDRDVGVRRKCGWDCKYADVELPVER